MAIYMWREYVYPGLCFTANIAGSTVQLNKRSSPTSVNVETSTDWTTWTDYTIWNTITLANVWDKVYMRNKSNTQTWFSTWSSNYYYFQMTWSISASWDVTYLLKKGWTTNLTSSGSYCFAYLFNNWSSWDNLITPPKLPATTLTSYCYFRIFWDCHDLETLPQLPATTLTDWCYAQMFLRCYKIKFSTTQTGEYQTPYRIPIEWTWTVWTDSLVNMFNSTWWTFTSNPTINTTYYTSNQVI